MKPNLSVIIPTYNEAENAPLLVGAIVKELEGDKLSFEIVIVDDNSPDRTAEKVKKKFPKDGRVKVLVRKNPTGLGTAILAGIKNSSGEIIIGMDADFNHNPQDIKKLLLPLDGADIVIASRFIQGGGMENQVRYVCTKLFNLLLQKIYNFPSSDNMSGFYAIRRNALFKCNLENIYYGYGDYHLRLVWQAKRNHLKFAEIPTFYQNRIAGKSKSNLLRMFFTYLKVASDMNRNKSAKSD